MLNKLFLYFKVLNKGEFFKRIEYKIKDLFKYFYIRNFFINKNKKCILRNMKIGIPNIKYIGHNFYQIFDKKISYEKIRENLIYSDIFWRKEKISNYDDIKVIWENNRLQFLLPIAIKYKQTNNNYYKNIIVSTLDYWKEKNKFEYSINWNNNLEVAIRAINIVMLLLILQDKNLNEKYSNLLYLHGLHLYNEINYSKYCIPNNHLIGEAVALLMLSKLLSFIGINKWEKKAIKILKKFNRIIDENGISIENSFSYQFFVTKMYILALSFIDDEELFRVINKKVLKSLKFLKLIVINERKILNYGDNDDAYLFSVYEDYNLARDIIIYYNFFFKRECIEETKIIKELLNSSKKEIVYGIDKNKNYFFNKSIFVYKWENNLLFFNAKNIEGHAHNDSLSLDLIVDGREVLVDSGTYSYNISKEKRDYYTSRQAHNTILFETNNAKRVGTFRWYNLYNSFLKDINVTENIIAIKGIIENVCERKIIINKMKKEIKIYDKSLTKNFLIKDNWIVNEAYLKDKKLYSKNIIFEFSCPKISTKVVNISDRYLCEKKINNYYTEYAESLNTKINI